MDGQFTLTNQSPNQFTELLLARAPNEPLQAQIVYRITVTSGAINLYVDDEDKSEPPIWIREGNSIDIMTKGSDIMIELYVSNPNSSASATGMYRIIDRGLS